MPRILLHLRPGRRARGATAVEYALVMALVVFAAIASIEFLGARGADEVVNQADCVSMRPPPTDCQVAAVAPNFVPGGTGFSSPTTAPDGTEPTPTANIGTVGVTPPAPLPAGVPWSVSVPVEVEFPVTEPPLSELPPVTVQARVRLVDPDNPAAFLPISEFVSCVTDVGGLCSLVYDVPAPFADVPALRIDQVAVDTVPPTVVNPPNVIDVLRPPP